MLNISENSINDFINITDYKSYGLVRKGKIRRLFFLLVMALMAGIFICLFLPWTQNINANGYVTTRSPEQRPQSIQSVIPGRLEKWYVQEGDFIEKGDTIVFLSEVKNEYFDPDLLARTSEQIDAKAQSIVSYDQKVSALKNQFKALQETLQLKRDQTENKIEQARNKISMDSIELVAFETNAEIAENQLERTRELYEKGLKTLTELQEKNYKVQEASAKVSVQKNKLLNQRNELINLTIELSSLDKEYMDKLSKSQSEQQSALSNKLESVAETSKLRNQYSNYNVRRQFNYITAPQSGYITKTIKKGIGETVTEGADIATIMPAHYDLAVEIYLKPRDMPLLTIGNKVQMRFDGWPAIVISGWPESSTGIFSGKIVAIDKFISDNGFYRALISPDNQKKEWPELLSIGTGTSTFILLNEVPIWYEVWRQLNGFPPDYYKNAKENGNKINQEAPLKTIQ